LIEVRLVAIASLFAGGCSAIFGSSRYQPSCESNDDCTSIDPEFVCGSDGFCLSCDRDGDGALSDRMECQELVDPTEDPDCDDADPDTYPAAPPICGDAKSQVCGGLEVYRVISILSEGEIPEIGPIGRNIAFRPGERIHDFDVVAIPPSADRAAPDVAAVVTYGSPGSRVARVIELNAAGRYTSREIDPASRRSMEPDWEPITDVSEVEMRNVVFPMVDEVMLVGALFVTGTDARGRNRVTGGGMDFGPQFTPFASGTRESPIIPPIAVGISPFPFSPHGVWREAGSTVVAARSGTDFNTITDPAAIDDDPMKNLYSTGWRLALGDTPSGGLFWWDSVREGTVPNTGETLTSSGRVATAWIPPRDGMPAGELGSYVVAYPRGTALVYRVLECMTMDSATCALGTEEPIERGVPTSQYDADFVTLAMIEDHGDQQRVALQLLPVGPSESGGRLELLTSDDVGGTLEDVRVSLIRGELGVNIAVGVLVTPFDAPEESVLWVTGARLCGAGSMSPIDAGVPLPDGGGPIDAGLPSDAALTMADDAGP
jgi:hypothetical protein